MTEKKKVFSLTRKDFRWDYYRGSGKGGQKRNKTQNCCRCVHAPSGATGKSEEGRSKEQNKKRAFRRMAESKEFQQWCKVEVSRVCGDTELTRQKVEREIKNVRVDVKEDGLWKEEKECGQ